MKLLSCCFETTSVLIALLGAGLVLGSPRAFGQGRDESPVHGTIKVDRGADLESQARITPAQAKAAARSRVSGATAEEAELEEEDGFLIYAVDVSKNGEEMEVLVDAGDGSVLRTEAEEEEEDEEEAEDDDEREDERFEEEEGEEAEEEGDEGEQAMRADLPQAVEDAFHEQYPQAEIVGTDVEHEGGRTFYEVESRDAGRGRDLLYRADGRIYEIEEQIAARALPAAVRRTAEKRGRIVKAERITRGDVTEYEVAVRSGGEEQEMVLNARGRGVETSGEEE